MEHNRRRNAHYYCIPYSRAQPILPLHPGTSSSIAPYACRVGLLACVIVHPRGDGEKRKCVGQKRHGFVGQCLREETSDSSTRVGRLRADIIGSTSAHLQPSRASTRLRFRYYGNFGDGKTKMERKKMERKNMERKKKGL